MTRSLIGRILGQAPPVRYASPSMERVPLFPGQNDQEMYMRSFGSVGTVWQCVSLLSNAVSRVEWRLYRKNQDRRVRYATTDVGSDQRTEVLQHQALSVLNRPNSFFSQPGLMEIGQQSLDLTGESWWVIERDSRASFPTGIWPVRADRMEPVPDAAAYLKGYVYTGPDREKVPLEVNEVIQVRYPNPLDPYRGLGPIQAILVDVDASRYSAEWNRNFFINSAQPAGVIQVDHSLDDDEWNALTNRWRETHRGVSRAHRVAVLEGGMTWVPNQMSMRDMDFTALRELGRDVIREVFGIHKVMLGVSDDVNRANAQTGEEVFAAWQVIPRLDRWKTALNEQFLPMFGTTGAAVEFDYVTPVPTNREQDAAELTAKSAAAQLLVGAGFDPADVLEVVGLPAMSFKAPAPPPAPVAPKPPADAEDGAAAPADDAVNQMIRSLRYGLNGHQNGHKVGAR